MCFLLDSFAPGAGPMLAMSVLASRNLKGVMHFWGSNSHGDDISPLANDIPVSIFCQVVEE